MKKIQTYTLKDALDKYHNNDIVIDFMSIDVESLEMKVLKSNDWKKYRPKVIAIEIFNFDLNKINDFEIAIF